MSLSDLTGLAGLTFTAATAACQRGTVKRCAGTAGVPPAMSAKREDVLASASPGLAHLQRVAGGTPAVPANH
jgi:hypothetical protein